MNNQQPKKSGYNWNKRGKCKFKMLLYWIWDNDTFLFCSCLVKYFKMVAAAKYALWQRNQASQFNFETKTTSLYYRYNTITNTLKYTLYMDLNSKTCATRQE